MKYLKKFEHPNYVVYNNHHYGMCLSYTSQTIYEYLFLYHDDMSFLGQFGCEAHLPMSNQEKGYSRGRNVSGRIFFPPKIISFWKFPEDNQDLFTLLKDIENDINNSKELTKVRELYGVDVFKFDNTWKIEMRDEEEIYFQNIEDYKKGSQLDKKDMEVIHNLTPEQKRKALDDSGYKPKGLTTPQGMSQVEYRNKKTKYKYTESFDSFNENIFNKAKDKKIQKTEKDYKIYCDLDGVLCDFNKQSFDTWLGKWNKENDTNYKDGWGFEAVEGTKSFWSQVGSVGEKFWSDMPWMKGGKILWNFIKDKNVEILSTPSRDSLSRSGKKIWCERELGSVKVNLSYQKQTKATPKSILIDDLKKNIDKWEKAGGIGILYKNTKDTLVKLKGILNENV